MGISGQVRMGSIRRAGGLKQVSNGGVLLQGGGPNGRVKDALAVNTSGVGIDTVFVQVKEVTEATKEEAGGGAGRGAGPWT